jgi:hypothetical protein
MFFAVVVLSCLASVTSGSSATHPGGIPLGSNFHFLWVPLYGHTQMYLFIAENTNAKIIFTFKVMKQKLAIPPSA